MTAYRLMRSLQGPTHLYEAWAATRQTGERVIVKRLGPWCKDDALLERLKAVAHVWEQRPSGLTGFVTLGESDTQCLVERWFDGDSVRSALLELTQRQVRPQLPHVVSLVVKAAQAVAAVHEHSAGTVHGDVSASSLLFDAQGDVLLTDFGVARSIGLMGGNGPARVESYSVAPEQLAEGQSTQASDVFRLGQLLYELVMGRPLFPAREWKASTELARAFAGLTAAQLPHVPEPFASLLMASLAKDPAKRPTAAAFCEVLTRHAAKLGCNVDAQVAEVFTLAFGSGKPFPSEGPDAKDVTLTVKTVGAKSLGRIATRKVSAAELAAEQEAQRAAEAARRPPPTPDEQLRDALMASGHLTDALYEDAKAYAVDTDVSLARALLALGSVSSEAVVEAQARLAGLGFMSAEALAEMPVPTEALALLPESDAEALCAVPLSLDAAQVTVAISDGADPKLARAVARACGVEQVTVVVSSESAVRQTIGRFYRGESGGELPSWLESPSAGRVSVPVEKGGPGASRRAVELSFETPLPMKAERLFEPDKPRGSPPRASRKSAVMMPMEYDLVELSSPSRAAPVSPPMTAKAPLMSPPASRSPAPVTPPVPARNVPAVAPVKAPLSQSPVPAVAPVSVVPPPPPASPPVTFDVPESPPRAAPPAPPASPPMTFDVPESPPRAAPPPPAPPASPPMTFDVPESPPRAAPPPPAPPASPPMTFDVPESPPRAAPPAPVPPASPPMTFDVPESPSRAAPPAPAPPASPPMTFDVPESPPRAAPPAPAPPPPSTMADQAVPAAPAALMTLATWPVLRALLALQTGGEEAVRLAELGYAVLQRLNASTAQLAALRFGAVAVATHNLIDRRQPWDAPSPDVFRAWAGESFELLEPVIGAWLFGRSPEDAVSSVFSVTFMLASVAGVARPAADDAAFMAIRSRLRATAGVVDALAAELENSAS